MKTRCVGYAEERQGSVCMGRAKLATKSWSRERQKQSDTSLHWGGLWCELPLNWTLAFPGENMCFGLEERVGWD